MAANVDLYNSSYGNYALAAYSEIRFETYGEDYGQTSWVTTAESHEIPKLLQLSSSSSVLEIGCGSGGYAGWSPSTSVGPTTTVTTSGAGGYAGWSPSSGAGPTTGAGGVVGAVAFRSFLAPPTREATLDDLLDQIDYLVELLGPDHVGLGTDFTEGRPEGFLDRAFGRNAPPGVTPDWPWVGPDGFRTVDYFPNVTFGLLARGYDDVTVRKILGENFLRVLETAWGG